MREIKTKTSNHTSSECTLSLYIKITKVQHKIIYIKIKTIKFAFKSPSNPCYLVHQFVYLKPRFKLVTLHS